MFAISKNASNLFCGLFCLVVCLLMQDCSQKADPIDCTTFTSMMESDQYYRKKNLDVLTPHFYFVDSLAKSRGYEKGVEELGEIDDEIRAEIWDAAKVLEEQSPEPSQSLVDSIWAMQNELDYKNSEELIDLIKSNGWEFVDSLAMQCEQNVYLIFVHTPEELQDDLRELTQNELKNMDENRYKHIMWHLNGRERK